MLFDAYFEILGDTLTKIRTTQGPAIERCARRVAKSVAEGGVLHIFGSGHSHMIAEDAFHRAGGLACVNAMLEPSLMELNVGRATLLERLPGYAETLLAGYDLREGEVIIVVSHSGINAVPIEAALGAKERGLHVVAITSVDHSSRAAPRHPLGKRLMDVAHDVIDNCCPYGDAALQAPGLEQPIGPASTVAGVVIIQSLIVKVVEELTLRGVDPPVFLSANRDGGDRHNERLADRYRSRVRYL